MDAVSERIASPNRAATHPLDEVAWQALTTVHEHLAEGDNRVRRYPASLAPFGAIIDFMPESFRSLSAVLQTGERIAFFMPEPVPVPAGGPFVVTRSADIDQMILAGNPLAQSNAGRGILELGEADIPEMLALAEETQPGPFSARILDFGRYLGIRQNGKLVAMAGERMRLPGFTEVSAVCVSAVARGQGLAAEVVLAVADLIRERSETPFLHVFSTNTPAAALYLKLGFTLRRTLRLTGMELAETGGKEATG